MAEAVATAPSNTSINRPLELPEPPTATIDAMASWLRQALKRDRPAGSRWGERSRSVIIQVEW